LVRVRMYAYPIVCTVIRSLFWRATYLSARNEYLTGGNDKTIKTAPKQPGNETVPVRLLSCVPISLFRSFGDIKHSLHILELELITLFPNKSYQNHITMSSSAASPRSPSAAARSTTTSASYRQYTRAGSSSSATENLPPRTLARVAREVRDLHKNPPENVRLVVDPATGMPNNLGELMVRTTVCLLALVSVALRWSCHVKSW
jgi:hypothetical protein